jgi:hypothetical protein
MMYSSTKFNMLSPSDSLITVTEPTDIENSVSVMFLYILYEIALHNVQILCGANASSK